MVLGIATEYQTGSTGESVKQIQSALAFGGYLQTSPDGIYGPLTKQAVQRFQSDKGLTIDGIVGPNTWAALMGGPVVPGMAPAVIVAPVLVSAPSSLPVSPVFVPGQPSPVLLVGVGLLALSGLMVFGSPATAKTRTRRKRR